MGWPDPLPVRAFVSKAALPGMETSIFICFFFSWRGKWTQEKSQYVCKQSMSKGGVQVYRAEVGPVLEQGQFPGIQHPATQRE